MLSFAEYRKLDALSLCELVKTKQVTPEELLNTALARAAQVNPKINAIVLDHENVARNQLKDGLPQGPLTGVPYLLKDLGAQLKGTVTTGSLSLYREAVAQADTTFVERCKKALALQGHRVLTHHQVPTNDGGLALGQVAVARSQQ